MISEEKVKEKADYVASLIGTMATATQDSISTMMRVEAKLSNALVSLIKEALDE